MSLPGAGPLPRGRCPVCGADVALRRSGELREHRDIRHAMYGVAGAVRDGKVPICAGSGLTRIAAHAVAEEHVR